MPILASRDAAWPPMATQICVLQFPISRHFLYPSCNSGVINQHHETHLKVVECGRK